MYHTNYDTYPTYYDCVIIQINDYCNCYRLHTKLAEWKLCTNRSGVV